MLFIIMDYLTVAIGANSVNGFNQPYWVVGASMGLFHGQADHVNHIYKT
jgi:hypothetical protein